MATGDTRRGTGKHPIAGAGSTISAEKTAKGKRNGSQLRGRPNPLPWMGTPNQAKICREILRKRELGLSRDAADFLNWAIASLPGWGAAEPA